MKSLEEKIKEISERFPEISDKIKPTSPALYENECALPKKGHYKAIEEIDFKENDEYKVAVAKWIEKDVDGRHNSQGIEVLTLYFKDKRNNSEIEKIEGDRREVWNEFYNGEWILNSKNNYYERIWSWKSTWKLLIEEVNEGKVRIGWGGDESNENYFNSTYFQGYKYLFDLKNKSSSFSEHFQDD